MIMISVSLDSLKWVIQQFLVRTIQFRKGRTNKRMKMNLKLMQFRTFLISTLILVTKKSPHISKLKINEENHRRLMLKANLLTVAKIRQLKNNNHKHLLSYLSSTLQLSSHQRLLHLHKNHLFIAINPNPN